MTAERPRGDFGPAIIGAILVIVGIAFLVVQQLDVDLGRVGWPLFVIVPGVVLLAVGLVQRGGPGLAIAGSIVTIVGLLLFVMNLTELWASWAYAWALVAPTGSGVGTLLYGGRVGNGGMLRAGMAQIGTGLAIFLVGLVFFEGLIGLNADRLALPEWAPPAALIALGVVFLIAALLGRRREQAA